MKTYVVIPTNRNLKSLESGWQETDLNKHPLIVVEDRPTKTLPKLDGYDVTYYSHADIDGVLGNTSWAISRGDSSIKAFGIIQAVHQGADAVLMLDDDVISQHPKFVEQHEAFLSLEILGASRGIINTVKKQGTANVPQKGIPKIHEKQKKVVMSYGLMYGYLDMSAKRIQESGRISCNGPTANEEEIEEGHYASISGSNLAIRSEALPAYYPGLMGKEYGIGKWGDVWAGLLFQRITQHLGKGILMGHPQVFHKAYGDNDLALVMEEKGYALNEFLWEDVPKMELNGKTFRQCYLEIADKLPLYQGYENYMTKWKEAMKIWADFF